MLLYRTCTENVKCAYIEFKYNIYKSKYLIIKTEKMEKGNLHKLEELIVILNQYKEDFLLSFGGVLVTDRHWLIININTNESSVTIKNRPENENIMIK